MFTLCSLIVHGCITQPMALNLLYAYRKHKALLRTPAPRAEMVMGIEAYTAHHVRNICKIEELYPAVKIWSNSDER